MRTFSQISAIRRGSNPFCSPQPPKSVLAHCNPPCLLARASSGSCFMGGSSGHLGQRYKWPGPGQAAWRSHSVPPQLSMPALSLSTSTLQPFPILRVAKPSFAHIIALPLPVLAPLQFPQSPEICILLCPLLCLVPVRYQHSRAKWCLLHPADVSQPRAPLQLPSTA